MKKKLLLNTIASGGHTAIVGMVGLLLLPFMLARLGVLEVGLMGIANIFAMSGYVGIFELGLQSSIAKYTSQYAASHAHDKVAVLFNSTIAVFLVVGIVLAAIGVSLAGLLAARVFQVPSEYERDLALALTLMFASYVILFPGIAIQGLLEGLQRFTLLKGIQAGMVLANAVGTVVLLLQGYRFLALVALLVAVQVTQALVMVVVVARIPWLRFGVRLFSVRSLIQIRRMAGFLFAGRVASLAFANTDRVLVGVMLGGVAMGFYDIVIKIPRALKLLLGFVNSAVMPAVSHLIARGHRDAVARLFLVGTNFHIVASYPLALAAMVFAEPLLSFWVGREYAHLAVSLRWALGYNLIVALIGIGGSIVVGSNVALRTFTAIGISSAALNIGLTVLLVRTMGLVGVFVATVLASAIVLPFYVRVFHRAASLSGGVFWVQVLNALLAGAVPLIAWFLTRHWLVPGDLLQLLGIMGGWIGLYWATLFLLVLGPGEREVVRSVFTLLRNPFSRA